MIFKKKIPSDINPNEKLNYNENDLLDELHARFFQSFAVTQDVIDFVPQKYLDKVYKRIFKSQKKQYRKLGKTNKEYQLWFKGYLLPKLVEQRQKELQEQSKRRRR